MILEPALVTEHKGRMCVKSQGKNPSTELLWSYYLLKLLQSNCSPAEPAVRRCDGAQHPQMDLLGGECINLPWCAHSQMEAGLLPHNKEEQHSVSIPHNLNNAGMSMPCAHHFCNYPGPQKEKNAKCTFKEGEREAGLT